MGSKKPVQRKLTAKKKPKNCNNSLSEVLLQSNNIVVRGNPVIANGEEIGQF